MVRTRVWGGLPGGGGGEEEAGGLEEVGSGYYDMPLGVQQRRRELVPLVFESYGYVAKLARLYITGWTVDEGGTRRAQGREGGGE